MSSKTPPVVTYRGRFACGEFVLTGLELFVKPLANAMSHYISCDGQNEGR